LHHEHALKKVINPFVYDQVFDKAMPNPTTPPLLFETYGQCFEDVIICQMIKAYAIRTQMGEFRLSFVEIGANHPVSTSASYLLNRTFEVNGILVEPNPVLAAELRKHRPNDTVVEAAVYDGPETELTLHVGSRHELSSLNADHVDVLSGTTEAKTTYTVPTIHINNLLDMMKIADHYVLFIDVEGMDWRLLTSIDFEKHRPMFIQIEPSEDFYPGTVKKMVDYMREKSYMLVTFNFVNLIFVDENTLP